jgi:hypothetical protein
MGTKPSGPPVRPPFPGDPDPPKTAAEAPEHIEEIEVLTRTTEILAKQVARLRGQVDWVTIQNAAHIQAQEAWDDAHKPAPKFPAFPALEGL